MMIRPMAKEIKWEKHVQGGDMKKGINTEVAKLTKYGILHEAIFPSWIANLVMVKKTRRDMAYMY